MTKIDGACLAVVTMAWGRSRFPWADIKQRIARLPACMLFSNQSFGASTLPQGKVGGFFPPQINSCSAMNHYQIISVSTAFYPLLPSILAIYSKLHLHDRGDGTHDEIETRI
jgi:hypothetical protein